MEIKNVLVKDIKYAPYNPRKISDEVLNKLKKSIEEFGYIEPIIVNKRTMQVVGGNQRLKVLRQLGIEEVQSVIVDLDDTHEKALNIALNKINGEWDLPLLKDLLLEIDTGEIDTELTGFDMGEIEELMNQFHIEGEEDAFDVDQAFQEIEIPITKTGDIWLLGKHRIMCGDSTKREDVERLMEGAKAIFMWTDPPYGVSYIGKTKKALKIKNDKFDSLGDLLSQAFIVADETLENGAPIYIAHPAGELSVLFENKFIEVGWHLHETLVWIKNSMVLGHSDYHYQHEPILYGWKGKNRFWYGDRKQVSIFQIDRPQRSEEHPTMKPISLIVAHIKNSSKVSDIGYDPFLGSGSTLIACEQTNRICYGMEIDPIYCDVIVKRWEEYTGKKAELLGKKNGTTLKINS